MGEFSERIVEISQDGAGLAISGRGQLAGFYTDDIQTCIVYAVRSGDGLLVIHDTGQLALANLTELFRRLGPVEELLAVQNPNIRSRDQDREHERRLSRLVKETRYEGRVQRLDAAEGWVAIFRDGRHLTEGRACISLEHLLDAGRRKQVNLINNLFSAPNSQSVSVDLQHVDGFFTPCPIPALEPTAMDDRARREMAAGDPDYDAELRRARAMGVLTPAS